MSENFLELFHFFLSVVIVVTAAGGFITKKKIFNGTKQKEMFGYKHWLHVS